VKWIDPSDDMMQENSIFMTIMNTFEHGNEPSGPIKYREVLE
jgi:hypothetical protein